MFCKCEQYVDPPKSDEHTPMFDKANGQWDARTRAKIERGEWTLWFGALIKSPRPGPVPLLDLFDRGTGSLFRFEPARPSRNCQACAHSYMEPDDDLTCGHPDSGPMGLYTHHAAGSGGHCGPDRTKFAQHPGRNPDGTLKKH